MTLAELRKRINELDVQLVELLNERIKVAIEIGRSKQARGEEIYAPAREQEVLRRVASLNQGPLSTEALHTIYREIMSAALALESRLKIAYLGPVATFTHQAARSRFGASVDYVPCETISAVFEAVEKKTADYGVVPIENSTEGAVTHTLDEFLDTPLKICAEIYLPISHHLMARGPREAIRRVYSNPQVFGQCRRWLYENLPGVELVPVSSTARAADMAAKEKDAAALAGDLAAEMNGLELLARDIQDLRGNTTRFLVIGRAWGQATGQDKTSVVFAVRHKVGALHDALAVLKEATINMSRIESRPSKRKAWEYFFFVDLDGHAGDAAMKDALSMLQEHTLFLNVLGSYPRGHEATG